AAHRLAVAAVGGADHAVEADLGAAATELTGVAATLTVAGRGTDPLVQALLARRTELPRTARLGPAIARGRAIPRPAGVSVAPATATGARQCDDCDEQKARNGLPGQRIGHQLRTIQCRSGDSGSTLRTEGRRDAQDVRAGPRGCAKAAAQAGP